AAAQARGLRVLIRLHGAPSWSNAARSPHAPPDDPARFAAFAAKLAARYPGILAALEVWPHPDLPARWAAPGGPSPEAYGQLLAQTAQAVHTAAPGVLVISGALAPDTFGNRGQAGLPAEEQFLAGIDRAGPDCLGVESLGQPGETLEGLRARLTAYSRLGAVCLTALGYPAGLAGQTPVGLEWSGRVTEAAQGEALAAALSALAGQEWPPLRLILLWNLDYAPAGGDPTDPAAPYSLLNLAGEPREAYRRMQALLNP
ncbi:MAG: hypothetical protein HY784_06175, partial [Chloroflexi bacterium]|nr:hypothetical protein [Chloroflexota bacterium]